ncbi:alpha/beta hydrolase [Paenibacillus arenilitoris]|uniref:Alpha/beta hydrolase n=1 Tax=Paenibacillus arenilitoris TaxID=2772299 RepID=A0A927H642_9BACL|nr:alpha/beta hydrolase [Paenibacillus arenilitoris]MBD2869102.1 alpha/beta hydrolase [Paenibacillus arenilitoris]
MHIDKIILPSEWGRDISHKHIKNDNTTVAVFFPGQNYSCELPLLYYTGKSAYDEGHDLLMLEYGYQSARTAFEEAKVDQLIQECYTSINQIINNYNDVVFVSKSLGTYIAGKTAELFKERSIRHVFLTPIRSTIPIIEKFGGLVVSGTKDPVFHEEDIEHIEGFPNTEVLRIKDANHALEVSDLHQSLEILKSLVEVSSRFFNHK